MHRKHSKIHPFVAMLALFVTPGMFFIQSSAAADSSRASSDAYSVAPDNTGRNVRDRSSDAVTPSTQSNNRSDIEITMKIRHALIEDKSLSTTARNIKVVTVGGTVILRGPVKSRHEKAVIADKALQIAGTGHVNDQLEIAGR